MPTVLFRTSLIFSLQTVTFQIIYATDGLRSYAFYHYAKDGMLLRGRPQYIGVIYSGKFEGFTDSADHSFLATPERNIVASSCKYGNIPKIQRKPTVIKWEYKVNQCPQVIDLTHSSKVITELYVYPYLFSASTANAT